MADTHSEKCFIIGICKSSVCCLLLTVLILLLVSNGMLVSTSHINDGYNVCGLICFYEDSKKNVHLCSTAAFCDAVQLFGLISVLIAEDMYGKCRNINDRRKLSVVACFVSAIMFAILSWTILYNSLVVLLYITTGKTYYALFLTVIIGQLVCWVSIHEIHIRRLKFLLKEILDREKDTCSIPLLQEVADEESL